MHCIRRVSSPQVLAAQRFGGSLRRGRSRYGTSILFHGVVDIYRRTRGRHTLTLPLSQREREGMVTCHPGIRKRAMTRLRPTCPPKSTVTFALGPAPSAETMRPMPNCW